MELVKTISGFFLMLYVGIALITGLLASKSPSLKDFTYQVHASLDLPIMLVIILYCALTLKIESSKPKYRSLSKNRQLIDVSIVVFSLLAAGIIVYIKYFV